MPEGTGRPRWDWFREMFGEPPGPPDADSYTVTFSWLRNSFRVLPSHSTDEMVLMHVRAYIWMLLSICLFGDKTGAQAHVRWLPYLLRIDDLVIKHAFNIVALYILFVLRFVCLPYRTLEVEAVLDQHILQEEHRALWCSIVPLIYFGTIEWHQVDRVIPQFGGVQNRPHPALNIDFLHAKDGRGSDQWFPHTFQRWHALWATRFQQLFEVVQSADSNPTADFIQWWILATRRYLVPVDRFHHLPPDEIPVEAT
ncbi:hypothetical protein PIB30_022361 [Stylosanthes scabra]|uniref:Aminotransferase-like plant mobile domain-containing protein n=1 Tax=Stylosanthes scabra TaxID=79078 RepID=A0ABU6W8N3_9FABA|nr:hypothetical protein [Stylosanthes scabra]